MEENQAPPPSPVEELARPPTPEEGGRRHSCGCGGTREDGEVHGCGCGGASPASENRRSEVTPLYVYALGRIEPRLPSLGVEKEFAQATGRASTADLTDRQVLRTILSEPRNRYLARQMCYVFTVQGLDTYIVRPRDPVDLSLLIEALQEAPRATDLHVTIGLRGPIAPPDACNGLMLPVVAFDQIYTFDSGSLVGALPKPDGIEEQPFREAAEELLERVMHMTDNAGASDGHRALNYLVVRYPSIYAKTAELFASDSSLTAIETRPSRLSGARNILDVIFSYTNRKVDVTEKYFVRVDVTEEFPFLVTKLSPYYDR
ncbi:MULTISPECIES: hypothetical protein [unclassified Streptomyces]|uniref:cyanobactin maturation protease PatG family protein n=1 Tax=unclassified Streptomyces TaxID=2593676 RepID=UPI0035D55C7F